MKHSNLPQRCQRCGWNPRGLRGRSEGAHGSSRRRVTPLRSPRDVPAAPAPPLPACAPPSCARDSPGLSAPGLSRVAHASKRQGVRKGTAARRALRTPCEAREGFAAHPTPFPPRQLPQPAAMPRPPTRCSATVTGHGGRAASGEQWVQVRGAEACVPSLKRTVYIQSEGGQERPEGEDSHLRQALGLPVLHAARAESTWRTAVRRHRLERLQGRVEA
jgi:hypothetical protein